MCRIKLQVTFKIGYGFGFDPKPNFFVDSNVWSLFAIDRKLIKKKKSEKVSEPATNVFAKIYRKISANKKEQIILEEEAKQQGSPDFNEKYFEKMDENKVAGIEIKKLHKVYTRGNNHALKGLQVTFFKDEITAFLGHNGAGKSTTMHLLTGLYKPTAGTALIDGLDLKSHLSKIRKSLGFVPQHNVLFPDMTVKEHLWFYSRLKGLKEKSTKEELTKLLEDTGLAFQRHVFFRGVHYFL